VSGIDMSMRSAVLSAATPLLGAARRTLAAGASNSATAVRAFGRSVGSVQAASRLPISPVWVSPVGAHARAQGHLGGGRGGAATVLLRQMSSKASDGATADEDLDPYLPHRINFARAKEYIKANVIKGMSRDEVLRVHVHTINYIDTSCLLILIHDRAHPILCVKRIQFILHFLEYGL